MITKTTVKGLAHLRRLHDKLGAGITWEVLSEDKKVRIGIVERRNSAWLTKRVGWQEFPVRYWIGHKFWPTEVIVGSTRDDVIRRMNANTQQSK